MKMRSFRRNKDEIVCLKEGYQYVSDKFWIAFIITGRKLSAVIFISKQN